MSARSRARQVVLQLLYQDDLNPEIAPTAITQFLRKELNRNASLMAFALSLLDGVREHRAELDQVLAGKAENWSLERMAPWTATSCGWVRTRSCTPGRRDKWSSTKRWSWPSSSAASSRPRSSTGSWTE